MSCKHVPPRIITSPGPNWPQEDGVFVALRLLGVLKGLGFRLEVKPREY